MSIRTLFTRLLHPVSHQDRQTSTQQKLDAISRSQAIIEFNLDGFVMTANQNFLDICGYTLDELIGQHHALFVRETEYQSPEYTKFWQDLSQGIAQQGRVPRITKDGREIWLQASYCPIFDNKTNPIGVIKYATDITAQQHEYANAHGQLDAINKVQAIAEFELNGTIITANDIFLSLMGYRAEEVVGQHHRIFVTEQYARSSEYTHFWRELAAGHYQKGRIQRITKDGRTVWLDASYNPIFDSNGYPFKVVKYAIDLSDRYAAVHTLNDEINALKHTVAEVGQARESAVQSASNATQGHASCQQMQTMMNTITASAEHISEVIDLMDSLAFQTNLLALNASVEAARAGEHGRGFAVVAQEVRRLAQSSAESARKVRALIEESNNHIHSGADEVKQAGKVMDEVMQTTGKVTELMNHIADTTQQQSQKLAQLTEQLVR